MNLKLISENLGIKGKGMGDTTTIVRYGPPSNLDKHPYGTRIVIHKNEDTAYDLWVQLSNQDEPNWEYMGEFRKDEKPQVDATQILPD